MTSGNNSSFLLLSGGVGHRSGHHEPKQFFELGGHPMIAYSLIAANNVDRIGEIIINAPAGFEDRTRSIAEKYCLNKPFRVIPGGVTRQESSVGLARSAQYESVILHEAARPFIDCEMLLTLINSASTNASFCQPIEFSMCQVEGTTGQVSKGIPRESVFNIQLPQKFDRAALLTAHRYAAENGSVFTEDAVMVVDMLDAPVHAISGSKINLKITTWNDFTIGKLIMGTLNS